MHIFRYGMNFTKSKMGIPLICGDLQKNDESERWEKKLICTYELQCMVNAVDIFHISSLSIR